MNVKNFFDKDTSTLSYVVFDKITKDCLVIDPVLNFDLEESTFSTQSIALLIGSIYCVYHL